MEFIRKIKKYISKFWKRAHINQILILSLAIGFLAFLAYFAYLASAANVETLKQGLATSTTIYDKDGDEASKISANRTEGVSIDTMPDHLKNAVIAIEDHRFEKHRGFDVKGISRAFFLNLKAGKIKAGGSTITQQLTKTALLSPERTYKRKLEEVFLAIEMEKKFTKDEILEMYLNQVYFGSGAWGVQNASRKYFGKDVDYLTLSEAAMMAGIINRPSALDPYKNFEGAVKRRNTVLGQMKKFEMITEQQYEEAVQQTIVLKDSGGDPLKGKYPYYVDAIMNEAINLYGLTQDEILTRGYKIYTQMDQNLQSSMEKVYENNSLFPDSWDGTLVQSGSILLDPATGGIRALIGGRGEHTFRSYNRATQLTTQPGSVMKPLAVYTVALEEGYKPESKLKDESDLSFGDYKPRNYNGQYLGEVPMYEAIENSINVPAVWLLNEIGLDKSFNKLKKFGLPVTEEDKNLSLALGGTTSGFSPKQMAEAYAVFANGGERIESHIITKIVGPTGNIVAEVAPKKVRVTDRKTAEQMTAMLLNVVDSGTGRNAKISGQKVAGKTGSTQLPYADITDGTKDQWFVGYTPNLVGAVWLGYDYTDREHYLKGRSGDTVVPIFRSIMEQAVKYVEPVDFTTPSINEKLEEEKKKKEGSLLEKINKFDEKMIEEAEKWKEKFEKGKGNLKKFEGKLKETYKKIRGE
ncbi:transglycosylase domain-containing protein [Lederbergia lenta]|uniref:Penicillin-binding protein, 1A family n=1 Tax=Lederbergia lenta TaxID=1467 RepID=A0A2X4WTT9_LEDLE|nr:PBP1A family penicillin-binding protein [Lederbergia lenta]MCM3110538.1 PBP1A family penicillin-binding protein [Lederbergia lenta]MEC2323896.1 PBP1A family penicillin-binding protein [Lederbergia lenta]SQI61070.1 penicillin-binding protein, 1A family [Lederbergia lenta]